MSSVVLIKQLMDRGNLSDSDIAVIYKAVDKDKNRQATFEEVRQFVQRYGYPSMTTKELLVKFQKADKDGNNYMSLEEFLPFFKEMFPKLIRFRAVD